MTTTSKLAATSSFSCVASRIKYQKTRRGINATAALQHEGKNIAVLEDVAESIVANVRFTDPAMRAKFLAEAKAQGFAESSDDFNISEYARAIVMAAEQAMVDSFKAN